MYEDQMKALRWLANMFPYTHPVKSETDKMSNCIHLYCEQGANAIQELEITIAGLHEAIKGLADDMPRWIPVEERLPEICTNVLVAGRMKYRWEHKYLQFVDMAFFNEGEFFETFNDWYEGQDEFEITHWMPLPEHPKEVNTDGQ